MISILVPTYGRTALLAEMVECYLRQDLTEPSELVVLNDLRDQTLTYTRPLPPHQHIRFINVPKRFVDLGVKRNALVEMARYDVVTFWDDDDIYLPYRLSYGLELLGNRPAIREHTEWRMGIHHPTSLTLRAARPLGTVTITKEALAAVGGFPDAPCIQDCHVVVNLVKAGFFNNLPPSDRRPSTIYRLHADVARAHVTNAPGGCNQEAIRRFVIERTALALQSGAEPSGVIDIAPRWNMDYIALADQG